jgi:hypothetical protein
VKKVFYDRKTVERKAENVLFHYCKKIFFEKNWLAKKEFSKSLVGYAPVL